MSTVIFNDVQHLIDYLKGVKKEKTDHRVIMSADLSGQCTSPNKKNKSYKMSFAISGEAFKTEDLRNLTGSDIQMFVVAIVPNDDLDQDKLKEIGVG